jgi:hypothetical protein
MPCSFDCHKVIMNLSPVTLNPGDILPYLGIPNLDKTTDIILEAIEEAIKTAASLFQPKAIWSLLDVYEIHSNHIILTCSDDEKQILSGMAEFMQGCSKALLSVVTIGGDFDHHMGEIKDPLTAMVFDAAGSAAIALSGKTYRRLQSKYLLDHHINMGPTFSPGCQVFPLTSQRELFKALSPEKIGVQLTDECLMLPKKSVSYINPAGENLPGNLKGLKPCSICSMHKGCNMKGLSIE